MNQRRVDQSDDVIVPLSAIQFADTFSKFLSRRLAFFEVIKPELVGVGRVFRERKWRSSRRLVALLNSLLSPFFSDRSSRISPACGWL